MERAKGPVVSIVMLLRQPRVVTLDAFERAARDAFRDAPAGPKVAQMNYTPASTYAIALGPARMGIINTPMAYFRDIDKAAAQAGRTAARRAVLEHKAWMSVDYFEQEENPPRGTIYVLIGRLIAELL